MPDAVLFNSTQRILIGKLESTHGTDSTPSTTDNNVWIYDPKFNFTPEFDSGLNVATPDSGKYADIPGARSAEFSGMLKFSPGTTVTAAGAANWGKFMQVMGTSVNAYTTKGHSYLPVKAGERNTMTLQGIEVSRGGAPVGYSRKIVGAMGDGSLECKGVGKPLELSFKMRGKLGDYADLSNGDLATISAMTSADSQNPYIATSMTVTAGGVVQKVSSFKLDFGNKIEPEINTADATGYDFFSAAGREPKFSYNPLKTTKAIYDPIAKTLAGTQDTVTLAITGTVPITIVLCNTQIIATPDAEREGFSNWAISLKLLRNGVDGAPKVASVPVEAAYEILIGARA